MPSLLLATQDSLPPPADPALAELGFVRWREMADELDAGNIEEREIAAAARALADDTGSWRLLASIFGNSPFLTQCCLKEPGFLLRLLRQDPQGILAELIDGLNRHLEDAAASAPDMAPDMAPDTARERAALMLALRRAKRRAALLIALADITGAWSLSQVTQGLSRFAEAALGAAVRHLLAAAARAGEIALPHPEDPERQSGLIVLAMGKLGAGELNYSSDIDLILLFDVDRIRYTGRRSVQQCMAGLARDLVRLLDEHTAEGYVFRTDLRLRPDPASTPPALSVAAALAYYESTGQNWERAAMIKARPLAGDRAAGEAFLADLRPFLWRKSLDFAAIHDIHSIKRQINAYRGGERIAVAGHNIKLGRGGIREIEFFAQTQQLIWGGRLPAVRVAATCAALDALTDAGRIAPEVNGELQAAYRFLRRVEHRLQMVEDAQTHTLPADPAGLSRIAIFLGYPSSEAFAAELLHHLGRVEAHYAELFEEAPTLAGPGNLVFTGSEDDPETLKTLGRLGFADPAQVAATVRGWHHGRYRAMRSQRSRELLTELAPTLLRVIGATANPDVALMRFDQFLAQLPAGVQLFSLFHARPELLDIVAEIMGSGPRLADQLARRPWLLDGVLSPGFFDPLPDRAALAAELARALDAARDYQDVLDITRRWANDRKFQIGVQLLRPRLDGDAAGAAFADIAETVIEALLPRVTEEFARSHGSVAQGALAVLGLGKLGGREMTVTSDLDLILVYDAPDEEAMSSGPRPLPVSTYYARLAVRLINALTALTQEGNLYDVDMRLRPSGTAGPIASSFAAFRRYHGELAWTWEHMALTRARPVAGPAALRQRVMAVVEAVLTRPRDADRLLIDVADMRLRLAERHRNPSFWEVKHRRGGMVDVEFITQYLELREAARDRAVLHPNTNDALDRLARQGVLAPLTAAELGQAMRLWRNIQGLLKLTLDGELDEATAPEGLKARLARGAGAVDFAGLKTDMTAAAARVRKRYRKLIERPAAAARARLAEAGAEAAAGNEASEEKRDEPQDR